jgi:hypothetical protein
MYIYLLILLRGIQFTHVQRYRGSTVKMLFMFIKMQMFIKMRPIHMRRSGTPDGVWCAHFPSVITTIIDHKLQLLKPLNKRELYAT